MAIGRIESAVETVLSFVRWQAFDTSTEEGRTQERYRRALLTVIANALSKSLSMIVMIVSIPLTLSYLGNERFGIWMTISSFASLLAFLDFGVGNGLLNQVANAAAEAERERLRHVITNGLLALSIGGFLVGAALLAVSNFIPWDSLIKVSDPALVGEIRSSARNFAVVFGVSLPMLGIQRVFLGLQEGFLVHAASSFAQLVSLGLLLVLTANEAAVPELILATFGIQAAEPVLLFPLLIRRRLLARFSLSRFFIDASSLLRTSGVFFVLQLGTMVGWAADNLIISSTLGAAQVAVYSVTQRLFHLVTKPLGVINAPLWSAYADAHAHGDQAFIRKTLRKSMLLTAAITTVGGGLLFGLSPQLIGWWTKGTIAAPLTLVLMFFVWSLCEALGNSFAMMMNGCGVIREQVLTVLLLTTLALPAKLISMNYFGMTGMLASYTILYCAIVLFSYGIIYRNNLTKIIGPQ